MSSRRSSTLNSNTGAEEDSEREMGKSTRIVLVPFPAQGHVSPMLHLARILHAQGFEVTVATPDFIHRRLAARAGTVDAQPPVQFAPIASGLMAAAAAEEDDTPPDFAAINRAMEDHMPAHLERLLLSLTDGGDVACAVVDLVASWAIPVAKRCGVPVAGFWPAMQATYRIISAIPELIRRGFISEYGSPVHHLSQCQDDHQVAQELMLAGGRAKLSAEDLPWLVGNSASQKSRFVFWRRVLERAKLLQCVLVNSFPDEGGQQLSQDQHGALLQVLPIAPALIADHGRREDPRCSPSMWDEDFTCLQWLRQQRPGSVVYVSFGSWVAPLPPAAVTEFALGLEAAGLPFLWVLRDDKAWRAGLPPGFATRTTQQENEATIGRVVAWAPQEEVLRSEAVGCYLTHCGWNSTVEAVRHEKRLLCYPIAGDQFVNAAFIVQVWGIGAMLDGCSRLAVEGGIKRVMGGDEGEKMQGSVVRLKKRIMGDEGSSRALQNLQCFVDAVKRSTA